MGNRMTDGLTEKQKQIVEEIKAQLPMVYNLPNPSKSRCLLSLAYEYFLLDMEEEAFKLLKQADPNYFGEQLGKDLEEIPQMTTIILCISSKLMELGLITLNSEK
jgi:hypothetical protein